MSSPADTGRVQCVVCGIWYGPFSAARGDFVQTPRGAVCAPVRHDGTLRRYGCPVEPQEDLYGFGVNPQSKGAP